MKKHICTWALISGLLLALPITKAKGENVIIGDDDGGLDARTTDVTLAWDPNRENDIAGYNVYYGRSSGDYFRVETVAKPSATITIKGSKTMYFAVTAFNADGLESDFSDEVHYP
ncbi:MAG TPA: fibronectin type III domain-containing protein [Chthoniobacterales bacterium]|jgi:hypothetical protein|nr:fibronectin type III domain-containing protein [Chthoniobacterales bacterium]